MPNPYLQGQADAITRTATQNLQNTILPGVNGGAMAAGGYGGARHGIMQGLAIGQTNQGLTDSLANLYGGAYEQDQNRSTQQAMQSAQLASAERTAQMQNQTQRDLGFGGLNNQWGLGLLNYGLGDKQADQQFALGQGNLGLGFTQAGNQYDLGRRADALGQQQAAQNFALGQGGLQNQRYGMDQTYGLGMYNAATQRDLGQQAQNTNAFQAQTSRDLGFTNADINRMQANQGYDIGLRNNALGQQQAGNAYDLGLRSDALGRLQAGNQYDLGLRNAGTNQYQAETGRQIGLGQLDESRYQFDTNTDRGAFNDNFNRQLAGLQAQLGIMDKLQGWQNNALGLANQQYQQPIQDLTALTNIGSTIGGQGGTASTPYQGNPWLGALGGAQLGGSLWNSFFKNGG